MARTTLIVLALIALVAAQPAAAVDLDADPAGEVYFAGAPIVRPELAERLEAPAVDLREAQPEPNTEAGQPEPVARRSTRSPVAAAGWCTVDDSEEEVGDASATEDEDPGCDMGAGLRLWSWNRVSAVVVLGLETMGTGLAWTAHSPESGPALAVAVGVVVRYGIGGVYLDHVYPAVGATLSFGRAAGLVR